MAAAAMTAPALSVEATAARILHFVFNCLSPEIHPAALLPEDVKPVPGHGHQQTGRACRPKTGISA